MADDLGARTVTSESIQEQVGDTRGIIAKCLDLLKMTLTDTFLGGKTQEPFPSEDDDPQISAWLNSKELQPPK